MPDRTGTLLKKGKRWYAVASETDSLTGKRRRVWLATGCTKRRAAETKAKDLLAPFLARDKADRLAHLKGILDSAEARAVVLEEAADPGISIRDAFDAYDRHPKRPAAGDATMDQYRVQWGRFEKWLAEKHPDATHMKQITPALAVAFMDHLNRGKVSPNTFNKYRNFLRMVFRVLAKDARLPVNPWSEIETRKLQTARHRALTKEEADAVVRKATGELRVLLALGAYTGARFGDCCTMTWGSVDLVRGEIRFSPRKTASRTDGKTLTVPVHPVLAGILSETSVSARRGYIVPETARRYLERGPATVSQSVQAHFEACGIQTAGEGGGKRQRAAVEVGFHSLRHYAVSMLREAGVSMSIVMAITGHSSAALVDVYTHAGSDAVRAAVLSLPAIGGDYAPPETDAVKLAKVIELAGTMTADNWQKVQAEIVSLKS